jgi:hypothetical protein
MELARKIVVFSGTTRRRRRLLIALANSARGVVKNCTVNDALRYVDCDVAVVWGLPKPLGMKKKKASDRQRLLNEIFSVHRGKIVVLEAPVIGRKIISSGSRPWWIRTFFPANASWTHFLLPERLYLSDPYHHFRIGLGGFPDDGAMALAPFAPARWETFRLQLGLPVPRPWRKDGSQIVVIGQVPGDSSLRGLDIFEWILKTCVRLRDLTDRPIIVRPHPLSRQSFSFLVTDNLSSLGVSLDVSGRPLSETLAGAWAVVTYSSGAAIDAILSGVPAIALSSASFAWDVADHTLESVVAPSLPDRGPWLERLAAVQWSEQEIVNGEVWDPLLKAILGAALYDGLDVSGADPRQRELAI